MKKIVFSDRYGLTQAVLSGRKTMTRRIAYTKPMNHELHTGHDDTSHIVLCDGWEKVAVSRYVVFEEVAVAQRYANDDVLTFNAYDNEGQLRKDGYKRHQEMLASPGYRNKMFVKAEYMPYHIRITNIKVERLQDISEEDCLKEGVEKWIDCYIVSGIMENKGKNNVCFDTPREAFAALIDRISGKGTWNSNPWVFAYTFELLPGSAAKKQIKTTNKNND